MSSIHKQKGVVFVEAALILPLLILFVVGIFQIAMFYYNQLALMNATAQTARYASLASVTTPVAVNAQADHFLSIMGISPYDVAITTPDASELTTTGTALTISIELLQPVLGFTQKTSVTVRKEGPV